MTMMAVGVADTGTGLTEEMLESAKVVIASHSSKAMYHGAQGTGFGLYHAHLQTKAINTSLQLARVEDCRGWLNEDMLDASMQYHESMQVKNIGTYTTAKKMVLPCLVPEPYYTLLYQQMPQRLQKYCKRTRRQPWNQTRMSKYRATLVSPSDPCQLILPSMERFGYWWQMMCL